MKKDIGFSEFLENSFRCDWDRGFLSGIKNPEHREILERELEDDPETSFVRDAWVLGGDERWGGSESFECEFDDSGVMLTESTLSWARKFGEMAEELGWIREYLEDQEII